MIAARDDEGRICCVDCGEQDCPCKRRFAREYREAVDRLNSMKSDGTFKEPANGD